MCALPAWQYISPSSISSPGHFIRHLSHILSRRRGVNYEKLTHPHTSPPRFLPSLTTQLPNLTSLTLYSLTLGGPSPHGSQKDDALQLINTTGLRELHVIDVFTSAGFWTQSSPQALKVVEFAYKYRREEEGLFEFLDIDGIVEFVGRLREVVGLTVCLSLDGEEGTGRIDAVRGEKARRFAEAVEKVGMELVVLDGTMFELQLDEVDAFLKADLKLKVLAISISLDGGWEKTLARLSKTETGIQELEVVGVDYNGEFVGLEKEWVGAFEGKWSDLRSVKVSVLKSGSEHWLNQNGTWTKKM